MRRGGAVVRAAAALAVATLLLVAALAGLRSPAGTEALAAELAASAVVQELVSDALIDELLVDARTRLGPVAAALLPIARPGIEHFVRTAVSSPAGEAALASALTDTIRQVSVRGPKVIDLRAALEAAVAAAPAELAPVLRALLDGRDIGLLVLGVADEDALDAPAPARVIAPGTIAGLPSGAVVGILALVTAALLAAAGPKAAGTLLLVLALPTTVVLWVAPGLATDLLGRGFPEDGLIGDLAPVVAAGLGSLLAPVRLLAGALAAAGAGLLIMARIMARRVTGGV
jgi:hypothetical protein